MSFLPYLEAVVKQVDGALAASVMGFDGIAVETHPSAPPATEIDLSSTWVEYANVLSQLKTAAEQLKTGDLTEVSVNSAKLVTLMRMITPDYFLVLALRPEANIGKGRFVLRIAAPRLKAEL